MPAIGIGIGVGMPEGLFVGAADIVGTPVITAIGADSDPLVFNLPAGIQPNEFVVLLMSIDGNPTVTTPTDWATFGAFGAGAMAGSVARINGFARVAPLDGSWPGIETTVLVDLSAAEEAVGICFRVKKHSSSINTPNAIGNNGTSTSPDSSNLAPAAGFKNYLWLSWFGADGSNLQAAPTYPGGFTPLGSAESGQNAGSVTFGAAYRRLAAASLNPGSFSNTLTAASPYRGATVAIHPGSEG